MRDSSSNADPQVNEFYQILMSLFYNLDKYVILTPDYTFES